MKNLWGNHLNGLSLCLLIESCSQIWYDFLLYPILKQKHWELREGICADIIWLYTSFYVYHCLIVNSFVYSKSLKQLLSQVKGPCLLLPLSSRRCITPLHNFLWIGLTSQQDKHFYSEQISLLIVTVQNAQPVQ